MLVVLVVAVVLVGGAVVVLLGGVSALTGGHGDDGGDGHHRSSGTVPAMVIAGGVCVLVLVVVVGGGLLGAGGSGPGGEATERRDGSSGDATAHSSPTAPPSTDLVAPSAGVAGTPARLGRAVRVRAADETVFADVPVIDRLADDTVVPVTASGFVPDTDGTVAVCHNAPFGPTRCSGPFPVRFDGAGIARFQYLVAREGAGRCGPDDGCVLAVTGIDDRLGAVSIVFAAAALAPGWVTVSPQTGLQDDQAVRVALTGFPPGARVQLTQCVPPGQPVAERCGAPGPVAPLTVGEDGRASATFRVRAGSVGSGHHSCQRGRMCALSVIMADGAVGAPVVPITFSAGRGASYHAGRLTIGLLVATVLAGLATWLVRTTDWREPSEAATPELDAASFGDP